MKAVIFARVSTQEQEHGHSIDAQLAKLREYCKKNNLEIIEKFGSKVIALAMNTEDCTNEEALELKAQYEDKLQLPVLAPLQKGVGELIPVLRNIIDQVSK